MPVSDHDRMDTRTQAPTPGCRQLGLSLVETVTVLAVLVVLAGLSLPGLRDLRASHRMHAASVEVLASLQQARMRAVAQATQVILCPSLDGHTCSGGLDWQHGWLAFTDRNRNRRLDANETVTQVHGPLPEGVRARSTIGRPLVIYREDGSAFGNPVTLTLCDDRGWRHGRAIVINQAGRARTGPAAADRCPTG
jgi:type IV fimbrial biogenesis protein FimT